MDTINVLIIEDEPDQSDALCKVLVENKYNIAGVARNYKDALQLIFKSPIDIIIIDVFLDGKPFVFLTSSQDRQIFEKAKLTKPFSFLMKPYNELEILYALEMAVEKFYEQPNVFSSEEQNTVVSKEFLFIKKKNSLKKIALQDIVYIEVENRYCNIFTENEKFLIQISLNKIRKLIDEKKFIRTHRNYVVNKDKIDEIILSDNLIILKGNHRISLSNSYKNFIDKTDVLS
mgnify:CR=1 FL=1